MSEVSKVIYSDAPLAERLDAWMEWCKLWDIQEAEGIADRAANEYTL